MKTLAAHNTQGVKGWAVAEPHPSGDGSFYAPIAQGLSESDALFIVRACNRHEAMVDLLTEATTRGISIPWMKRAALALAKEGL